MNRAYIDSLLEQQDYHCPVCGQKRYITDRGNHECTVHCSSAAARFWEFDRGTMDQTLSKQHWDQSRLDLYFTLDDILVNFKSSLDEQPPLENNAENKTL